MADVETQVTQESTAELASKSYLLQAHVNEYQALTMRNTYWITLQFACWPIMLLFVALVAQLSHLVNRELLIWGSSIVVQVVVLTWYQAAHEMYSNVIYMETRLRDQMQRLIGAGDFWGYENYLREKRGRRPLWSEVYPAIGCLAAYSAIAFSTWPWSLGDVIGVIFNFVVLAGVLSQCVNLVKMRERFTA
jgi:hypothetical protein